MKNSPLTTILLAVLTVSVLASLVMCWLYISATREMRTLQTNVSDANMRRGVAAQLASDAIEYNKANPNKEMEKILEDFSLKQPEGAPAGLPAPGKK